MASGSSLSRVRAYFARDRSMLVLTAVAFAPWCWLTLAERWRAAGHARFPGHADPAFYYSLAKNLAAGRGPVIDYVWHFWVHHDDLTHFGPDYWLPLPSLVLAAAFKLAGTSVAVALRTTIAASLALAGGTWALGRALGLPRWGALAAAALLFISLPVSKLSVQVASSLYYSTFVLLAFAAGVRARTAAKWWVVALAGVLSGCAQLCRSDGVLVLLALLVAQIAWWVPDLRRRLLLTLGGHCLALVPYAIALYSATGRVMPGHGALPFLTEYEDLYAVPPGPGLADVLRSGIWEAVLLRQRAAVDRAADFVRDVSGVPALALMLGAGALVGARLATGRGGRSVRGSSWLAPLSFALFLCVLHTAVTPVASAAGALSRSLPTVVAILLLVQLRALTELRVPGVAAAVLLAALLGWPWFERSKGVAQRVVTERDQVADQLEPIRRLLDQEARCFATPLVVMTRDPWELTELTGHRSVQIPNADAATIVATAQRFGVTHLIPSPRRRAMEAPQIHDAFQPTSVAPVLRWRLGRHTCP